MMSALSRNSAIIFNCYAKKVRKHKTRKHLPLNYWYYFVPVVSEGQAANMEIRPDNSWPDVVYYNSYTLHAASHDRSRPPRCCKPWIIPSQVSRIQPQVLRIQPQDLSSPRFCGSSPRFCGSSPKFYPAPGSADTAPGSADPAPWGKV